ncbi:Ankyrin repeat-containing protein BDA1 [Bienertia sinuspersici]
MQVVEMLLRNCSGILEVNAVNKSGLTALDLLLIFPSEAGDREIQDILQSAGATKAQNLNSTTCYSSANLDPPSNSCRSKDLIDFFRFHEGRDSPSDVRTTLLVIAVLVAAATYQVGISPPGDVWQEDDQGLVAGTSILATRNTELQVCIFALYMTFNTAVAATSAESTRAFTIAFTSVLPTVVPLSFLLLRKFRVIERIISIFRIQRGN